MARQKQPYFQFKEFSVWHQQSQLKVCTEACILGAYVPVDTHQQALDIGTGTGLLALMMAQRNRQLKIDAVEIDSRTANEATSNVALSKFANQINVYNADIQSFVKYSESKYDLIISNPPFFNNHLQSVNTARNRALHTNTLPFEALIETVNILLTPQGKFVVLLPLYETQLLTALCHKIGLFCSEQVQIFQRKDTPIFRLITTFERVNKTCSIKNFTIYDSGMLYSADFQTLLKDFYLKL